MIAVGVWVAIIATNAAVQAIWFSGQYLLNALSGLVVGFVAAVIALRIAA